jgi:hypothetical protein
VTVSSQPLGRGFSTATGVGMGVGRWTERMRAS